MRRKVFFLVATALVTLSFAKWFEVKDRADHMLNPQEICWKTRDVIRRTMSSDFATGRGCKVKYMGGGTYEVESSLSITNYRPELRCTILITEGAFTPAFALNGNLEQVKSEQGDYEFNGKLDKIRIHGYHVDFVPFSDFLTKPPSLSFLLSKPPIFIGPI